jgi:hypothetical protein
VRTEDHVERREYDFARIGLAREIVNEPVEFAGHALVVPGWRRIR